MQRVLTNRYNAPEKNHARGQLQESAVSDASFSDYEILQLLRIRAARIRGVPSPPVPVSISHRLAALQWVSLPADPGIHYRGGCVQITDAGLMELQRRFLFCFAEGCAGVVHDWTKGAIPASESLPLCCPDCGSVHTPKAPAARADRCLA
jgi:hypothetical protein